MPNTYSIADQQFLSLSRMAGGPKEQLAPEARAGVDGLQIWRTGKRGEPFEVLSVVDLDTKAEAAAKLREYEALIGQAAETITWAGYIDFDLKVVVKDVQLVSIREHVVAVGGLQSGKVLLRCQWVLIPVDP